MTDIQTARHDRLKGAKSLERVILDPGDFQWMLDTVQTYRDHLCPAQTPQQVLSGAELELCADLGQCYHEFTILPAGHPSDVAEFASHIHALQNLVMARLAARVHPEDFPNYLVMDGQARTTATSCGNCGVAIHKVAGDWVHSDSLGRACRLPEGKEQTFAEDMFS